jgi:hypothetical protein
MGTIKLGNDYLLWVESVTPGTYNYVDGQGSFNHSRSYSAIGTATKTSQWDTERAGLPKGKADAEILPSLPDTVYARLETLCKAVPQVPFNIQVRKNGTSGATPGDVVFACSVTCDGFDEAKPQNDVVKSKISFLMATAPTTDTLA